MRSRDLGPVSGLRLIRNENLFILTILPVEVGLRTVFGIWVGRGVLTSISEGIIIWSSLTFAYVTLFRLLAGAQCRPSKFSTSSQYGKSNKQSCVDDRNFK